MPKLPRISGDEAVRVFEKLGFTRVRQRGSHVVPRRGPSGCVIPLHRELKVGSLQGALRQSNVSSQEFLDAYNR